MSKDYNSSQDHAPTASGGKMTEQQIMAALARLERGWPKHLWLLSFGGSLMLMSKRRGERMMTESGEYDQDFCLQNIGIENDGCG